MEKKTVKILETKKGLISIIKKNISAADYIEFLTKTDLGSQYPKERFQQRIARLVKNVQISLLALNTDGKVVGVCFGLTDFAYWLMVTDLAVDRDYVKCGIGSEFIRIAREGAGGEKDIIVFINANDNAVPFYMKNGLTRAESMMELGKVEWTGFTVTKEDIPR